MKMRKDQKEALEKIAYDIEYASTSEEERSALKSLKLFITLIEVKE